jgi:hypothetical protein
MAEDWGSWNPNMDEAPKDQKLIVALDCWGNHRLVRWEATRWAEYAEAEIGEGWVNEFGEALNEKNDPLICWQEPPSLPTHIQDELRSQSVHDTLECGPNGYYLSDGVYVDEVLF